MIAIEDRGSVLRLFIGDDWAEQHHDVELMDAAGRVLAKARLPEGVDGMARLHEMDAAQFGDAFDEVGSSPRTVDTGCYAACATLCDCCS
ncbi:hypothetical protein [Actinomadura sp. NPDC048394]|uniref:hypothetical protein n=1 Tax=Actinomadura sp. NPDC048394 TaxID=3158223 RepID=UPI0033EC2084